VSAEFGKLRIARARAGFEFVKLGIAEGRAEIGRVRTARARAVFCRTVRARVEFGRLRSARERAELGRSSKGWFGTFGFGFRSDIYPRNYPRRDSVISKTITTKDIDSRIGITPRVPGGIPLIRKTPLNSTSRFPYLY
jgi:hypothetical protein